MKPVELVQTRIESQALHLKHQRALLIGDDGHDGDDRRLGRKPLDVFEGILLAVLEVDRKLIVKAVVQLLLESVVDQVLVHVGHHNGGHNNLDTELHAVAGVQLNKVHLDLVVTDLLRVVEGSSKLEFAHVCR